MSVSNDINNENEIIFTIGRMNPPTPGHVALIETLIKTALSKGLSQINIILSHSVDNVKNPLECEEKRMILYSGIIDTLKEKLSQEEPTKADKIKSMVVEIICMDDETPEAFGNNPIMKSVEYILTLYGYPREGLTMYLIIGEDRKNGYKFIGDGLSKKSPPVGFDDSIVLPRSESAMSATYIRGLATSGTADDKQTFLSHYAEIGIPEQQAEYIYDQIRDNIEPPAKKAKTEKGANGGTKRKRKNKKSKRKTRGRRRVTRRHR